jgi:cytochrome c oxidase assembly protein subunit 15
MAVAAATMNAARWLRLLTLLGVLLCLIVVVLGAYVRLTAAGLGCPDWPGCYGHATPAGAAAQAAALHAAYPGNPLDVGKAWREMTHRYAATSLGLTIVLITALAIHSRRERIVPVGYAVALLATVLFQGVLGMLTVTWQLKPLIVTAHLVFGLTTLSLLWWLWLALGERASAASAAQAPARQGSPPGHLAVVASRAPRTLARIGLAALALQIALGGWTSSNYAAIACPDLPRCQNEWLPPMDYRDAFVLWRGLDVNYEGGRLAAPARTAIHFTHRLGALVAVLALLLAAASALRRSAQTAELALRRAALAVFAALALQLAIGILMVLRAFPLPLATAHNAGAALLLLATLLLNRRLRADPAALQPPLAGSAARAG